MLQVEKNLTTALQDLQCKLQETLPRVTCRAEICGAYFQEGKGVYTREWRSSASEQNEPARHTADLSSPSASLADSFSRLLDSRACIEEKEDNCQNQEKIIHEILFSYVREELSVSSARSTFENFLHCHENKAITFTKR